MIEFSRPALRPQSLCSAWTTGLPAKHNDQPADTLPFILMIKISGCGRRSAGSHPAVGGAGKSRRYAATWIIRGVTIPPPADIRGIKSKWTSAFIIAARVSPLAQSCVSYRGLAGSFLKIHPSSKPLPNKGRITRLR